MVDVAGITSEGPSACGIFEALTPRMVAWQSAQVFSGAAKARVAVHPNNRIAVRVLRTIDAKVMSNAAGR
jgi:hypothetical protein